MHAPREQSSVTPCEQHREAGVDRGLSDSRFNHVCGYARKLALVLATLGAEAGLTGSTATEAQAGLVVAAAHDAGAQALGKQMVERGLVGYAVLQFDGPSGQPVEVFGGTVTMYSSRGVVFTAHQVYPYLDMPNFTMFVGTDFNYFSPQKELLKLGAVYTFPGYEGPETRKLVPDIAVGLFETPLDTGNHGSEGYQMKIADSRLSTEEAVLWAGYGVSGVMGGEYNPEDGAARGGLSYISQFGPGEGESEVLYVRTEQTLTPNDLRAARGDSGSGAFDPETGELLGFMTRAANTTLSTYALFVDATEYGTKTFVEGHLNLKDEGDLNPNPPPIPEPSTNVLFATAAAAAASYGAHRRSRSKNGSAV
jgi:hypothetical protein